LSESSCDPPPPASEATIPEIVAKVYAGLSPALIGAPTLSTRFRRA
jgi:hypothetical protein